MDDNTTAGSINDSISSFMDRTDMDGRTAAGSIIDGSALHDRTTSSGTSHPSVSAALKNIRARFDVERAQLPEFEDEETKKKSGELMETISKNTDAGSRESDLSALALALKVVIEYHEEVRDYVDWIKLNEFLTEWDKSSSQGSEVLLKLVVRFTKQTIGSIMDEEVLKEKMRPYVEERKNMEKQLRFVLYMLALEEEEARSGPDGVKQEGKPMHWQNWGEHPRFKGQSLDELGPFRSIARE